MLLNNRPNSAPAIGDCSTRCKDCHLSLMEPMIPMNTETELRNDAIDRLIAASLRDVATTREASLQHWRSIGAKQMAPSRQAIDAKSAQAVSSI